MAAKIITFGISKGGASKSTSCGITGWILSQDAKVLCIDMDGQGNLTSFLTGEYDICNVFEQKTVLEALIEEDARPYILQVTENLHIIPSNDYLATLSQVMYSEKKIDFSSLTKALEPVSTFFDYILIDTPPSLGSETILSLSTGSGFGADTYTVIPFDGSMFCYYAIPKYLDIISGINERFDHNVQVAGILFSIIDSNAKENDTMVELIDQNYPNLRFNTLIRRRAATRRLPIEGFEENTELRNALEFYYPFVEELKKRVNQGQEDKQIETEMKQGV